MATRSHEVVTAASDALKQEALALGFDAVGICALDPVERDALARWLKAGFAGTMAYMHRQHTKRQRPATIVPNARFAIVVLKNYYAPAPDDTSRVARYAWARDYHLTVGEDLVRLADAAIRLGATPEFTRAYVDAGPVPERELAQRAGLGWMGKNTMLIDPERGSFTFIGSVLTDLELEVDTPFDVDRCGTCRACLDACPTKAFPAARVLDATRCISYLTIEYRGPFTHEQRDMTHEWLFGCDICQDVCPWNVKFAQTVEDERLQPNPNIVGLTHGDVESMDQAAFDRILGDSALERTGLSGLMRNAGLTE